MESEHNISNIKEGELLRLDFTQCQYHVPSASVKIAIGGLSKKFIYLVKAHIKEPSVSLVSKEQAKTSNCILIVLILIFI